MIKWRGTYTEVRHPLGVRELTHLRWTRPNDSPLSPELQTVVDTGCLTVKLGEAYALEVCFDDEASAPRANLIPDLPVIVKC